MSDIDSQSEEIRGSRGRQEGGATISIRDPRMSRIIAWLGVTLGGALVTGIWIAANNLYAINLTLAANAVYQVETARQIASVQALNDRQEDHINAIDRRVYTVEGKIFRGVDGYEDDSKVKHVR